MVEDKTPRCVSGSFESDYGFDPFSKLIYFHEYVLLSITGWRTTSHEVYAPFAEGLTMMIKCKRVGGARALFS